MPLTPSIAPARGMKAKTIKGLLRRKFDDFLTSIEDETVRERVKNHTIITGGSIASMLLGEPVNDYDLYFTDVETVRLVARYYVDRFTKNPPPRFKDGRDIHIFVQEDKARVEPYTTHVRNGETGLWEPLARERVIPPRVKVVVKSAGIASEGGPETGYAYFEDPKGDRDPDAPQATAYVEEVFAGVDDPGESVLADDGDDKPKYRPVFLTSNAITLSDGIQLVLRFYGSVEDIHENFDFAHCTNAWDAGTGELTLRQPALEALLTRELRYQGSRYPLCSIFRTRKFIERGWTINAGQYLKMAMQLAAFDLTSISTLEDQLVGVDAAYFVEIIELLQRKFPDGVCPSAYLLEIVDRML